MGRKALHIKLPPILQSEAHNKTLEMPIKLPGIQTMIGTRHASPAIGGKHDLAYSHSNSDLGTSGYIDSTTPSQSIKDLTAHLILQTSAPLKSDTGSPVVANHSYSNHAADWTAAHDSSNGCGSINPHSNSDKWSDQAIQTLESRTCSSRPAILPIKKRKLKIPHDLPIKRNKVEFGTRLAISDIIDPIVLANSISSQYETDARIPSPGCDTMPLSSTQGLRRYNSDPPRNTRYRKSTARKSFHNRHLSLSYTRRSMRVNSV
ncbi:hypothetical protein BASA62_006219 [Batrachochytrium salamandrivorans]|nr:hypothetical protein BASA62_006219 [Batrachochytrium salamandrivorans]